MTARRDARLPATAPLLYWLTLVAGLAALTALRIRDLDAMAPLWAGSVLGSAAGQLFAARRLRLWLLLVAVMGSVWVVLPMVAGLHASETYRLAQVGMLPCLAGAVSGYASLTERGALLSFWFPAVPWMLAMLQGGERAALRSGASVALLVGLGALLVAFFRARETRRVALWQTSAAHRLAAVEPPVVLRVAPFRRAAHVAFLAALGAATLGAAAWIAPELWGREKLHGGVAAAARGTRPCCPEPDGDARHRVSEFLPLLDASGDEHGGPACIACRHGAPIRAPGAALASGPVSEGSGTGAPVAEDVDAAGDGAAAASVDAAAIPAGAAAASPPASALTAPAPLPAAPPPVAAVGPTPPPRSPPSSPSPSLPEAAPEHAAHTAMLAPASSPPLEEGTSAGWLLGVAAALFVAGLAFHVAIRPVRRLVTLRHLRCPLWAETVDQRVSNLWQLVLVGLHDAGFRVAPGEQPQELARRVGLAGMTTCATVLERARHGVRVDAADLAAMASAAESVYSTARGRAGAFARAAALVRWPLA